MKEPHQESRERIWDFVTDHLRFLFLLNLVLWVVFETNGNQGTWKKYGIRPIKKIVLPCRGSEETYNCTFTTSLATNE